MAKETQGEREPKGESRVSLRDDEWLRCVTCGHTIARRDARIEIDGKHVHTFVNPVGHTYTIGCFGAAPGCTGLGDEQSFWTWFPRHAWRIALCRACNAHLGWSFRASESAFWGLVVDRVA
jgi:hypothetical protein